MASKPSAKLPSAAALEALDIVVARAFGIDGGYLELNGVVSSPAVADFDMFMRLGLSDSPMLLITPALRKALKAIGQGRDRACLEALFIGYPGNVELRDWVRQHCPAMLAQVPEADFEAARSAYEQERMDRRVRAIRVGLTALAPALVLKPDQQALTRVVIRRLYDLNGYKAIHDALHELQMKVLIELGRIAGKGIPADERKFSLDVNIQDLRLASERIEQQFDDPEVSLPALSLRDAAAKGIVKIADLLQGSDPEAGETAEAGAGLLRALLRQQMGPFDRKLIETVDAIPFADFSAMLGGLSSALPPQASVSGDAILLANVGAGFSAIATRLDRRREVHGLWQQIDATLLNVEDLLRGAGRDIELQYHWANLADLLARIRALSADQGLMALPGPDGQTGDATADAAAFSTWIRSDAFPRSFGFFARAVRVRFQRADRGLLTDCQQLARLQQPLENLVGVAT